MMGIIEPVGLAWEERKLLRLFCRRWRTKATSPTITDAAKTTANTEIPMIRDFDTPLVVPVVPLGDADADAAFAVPTVEDGMEFNAGSSDDVVDAVALLEDDV